MDYIDIRHGDITINREPHPAGIELAPMVGDVVLAGDTGPHVLQFVKGGRWLQQGSTVFFSIPEPTTLSHPRTHVTVEVQAGDHVSRKLVESRGSGDDAAVED